MIPFIVGGLIGAGGGFVLGALVTATVIMFLKTQGVSLDEHSKWLNAKRENDHDKSKDVDLSVLRQDQPD